ncbi:hypothetical protein [Agromyces sp. NPDC055658]
MNHKHGASLAIDVSNTGRTSAMNVRIRSTPQLETSLTAIEGDKVASERVRDRLRRIFDGEIGLTLHPGRNYTYIFDALPAAGAPELPKSYQIEVKYVDVNGNYFRDTYTIEYASILDAAEVNGVGPSW